MDVKLVSCLFCDSTTWRPCMYYHYCCGVILQCGTWVICRTDCPLLWHPCGQCPHYPALSSYFWPGSDSGRNNSPANHLQYQSSRSPLILAIFLTQCLPLLRLRPGHVASSDSEGVCVSEDREILSPEVSIGVTWHVSSGYIALPASAECWQILTTGCWETPSVEARATEPRILSRPQWIQEFKDLTQ